MIKLAVFLCAGLYAQTATAPLAFEAAEITPVKSRAADTRLSGSYQHGRVLIHNATLRMLANAAYDMRFDHIAGGENWVDTDLFDVAAKADPATSEADSRLMLRALIEERFKLVTHREQKPSAVFVLVTAKSATTVQATPEDSSAGAGCNGAPVTCHKTSMAMLAQMLPRLAAREIDRPVVDLTGMKGYYDFKLSYGPGGRTIFDALEDIGLKLEAQKYPVDYLVIDRAERLPQ